MQIFRCIFYQKPSKQKLDEKLKDTLANLERKEKVLSEKAEAEYEKAKELSKAKNKRAAMQCLSRKRLYEQQIQQLRCFHQSLRNQMVMLKTISRAS